ncbi:MAG: phosphatase PAP2 family protein [Acidobacteriia bacterium]|nr:phosphatase PAP2 family protein [Terriglobia bacterium]
MKRELWPVDQLMLAYLFAIGAIVAVFNRNIAHSGAILIAHAAGMLLIAVFAFVPRLPGMTLFRHWYPLPYVALSYRELSVIIGSIRGASFDAALAAWDLAIWRAHPTVWLERIQSPVLTELMQLAYSLFVPSVLLVAMCFWIQKRFAEFRSYAFLITLGFLASYLGYLLVPVRGPRFFLASLQTQPLRGLWLFQRVRAMLDVLESAHYDCFPSGHVQMTVLAWWSSRRISDRLARVFAAYTGCVILATTYLRYHYTVDVMAGLAVASAILIVAPHLERKLNRGPSRDLAGRG